MFYKAIKVSFFVLLAAFYLDACSPERRILGKKDQPKVEKETEAEEKLPKQEVAKVSLEKTQILEGESVYVAKYSLSEARKKAASQPKTSEPAAEETFNLVNSAVTDPIAGSYSSETQTKYNPTIKYQIDKEKLSKFNACGPWNEFAEDYFVETNNNYFNLFAATTMYTMYDSDLARPTFRNRADFQSSDIQRTTDTDSFLRNKGACLEQRWSLSLTDQEAVPSLPTTSNDAENRCANDPCVDKTRLEVSGEVLSDLNVDWGGADTGGMSNNVAWMNLLQCLSEQFNKTYTDMINVGGIQFEEIHLSDIDQIAASGRVSVVPAVRNQYRQVVRAAKCQVNGRQYEMSESCGVFCQSFSQDVKLCYDIRSNPSKRNESEEFLTQGRRRFVTRDIEGYVPAYERNEPITGLTYMSIKKSNTEIYNVRIMHNLHKSHILGQGGSGESLGDGVNRQSRFFSFHIPFCPEAEKYYEYKVCNVPIDQHDDFGKAKDGTMGSLPNCFAVPDNWIISDVRIMDDMVGKSWSSIGTISVPPIGAPPPGVTLTPAPTGPQEKYRYVPITASNTNKDAAIAACAAQGDPWNFALISSEEQAQEMWDFLNSNSLYNKRTWVSNSCSNLMSLAGGWSNIQVNLDCSADSIVFMNDGGCDGGGSCMFGDTNNGSGFTNHAALCENTRLVTH